MPSFKSIVFSGDCSSGKSTIAKEVAKALGMPIHSAGDLLRAEYKSLKRTGMTFRDFCDGLSNEGHMEVNARIGHLVANGGVVAESRYVSYLRQDSRVGSSCLYLYVAAPLDVRAIWAKAGGSFVGSSLAEIRAVLDKIEAQELRVGRDLWNIDFRESAHYDAVIRASSMLIPQRIARVIGLFLNPAMQTTKADPGPDLRLVNAAVA